VHALGSRWDLELVAQTCAGVTRFDALQRRTGASRKILAERLKALVADEILIRVQYQTRPDRYEYLPTDKARGLLPVIAAMEAWSQQWSRPS